MEGYLVKHCNHIPNKIDCANIVSKFIGKIIQTPSNYSAIKINGKRAYELARKNIEFTILYVQIQILLVGKIPIAPVNPWNFWGSPQEFFSTQ